MSVKIKKTLMKILVSVFAFVTVTMWLPFGSDMSWAESGSATIVAGQMSSYLLLPNGSLWVWGAVPNDFDGRSFPVGYHINPAKVMENVAAVSATSTSRITIGTDGSLWAWGWNYYGQLGDGTTADHLIPTRIGSETDWVYVTTRSAHTLAIRDDGSLWAWGANNWGQLGDGTTIDRYTPIRVMDNVANAGIGSSRSWAITTDGGFYVWGWDNGSHLGSFGDSTRYLTTPTRVFDDARQAAQSNHSIATTFVIRTDGSLYAWGENTEGQIGNGTVNRQFSPVRVMENVVTVTSEGCLTMAIGTEGNLWAWGAYDSRWFGRGYLGNGTTEGSRTPVRIMNDVAAVSASSHSLALKTDGSLYAWGNNDSWQLGDGTTERRLSPVRIMDDVLLTGGEIHAPYQPESPTMLESMPIFSDPEPVGINPGVWIIVGAVVLSGVLVVAILLHRRKPNSTVRSAVIEEPENRYETLLNLLRASKGMVADAEIVSKIERVEKLAAKIFSHVEDHPNKRPQTRRISDYYIPAILKMIRSYSEMEKQGIKGNNLATAKVALGRTLDSLNRGFEQLLDQLFNSDVMDISTDMDVIEYMLLQDGLTGDMPFKIVTGDS